MAQQQERHRSLSDISHLFLSSVRERATGSAALPRRKPPVRQPSVDLTPEEFRHVLGLEEEGAAAKQMEAVQGSHDESHVPPIKAIIASHLGAGQVEAAKRYGRNLASAGKRVGLIVVDASEFSLFTFDASAPNTQSTIEETSSFDTRAMKDAVNELSCDIDQWLLLAMNPRLGEARSLLRDAGSWVVLSTCDHEGIVACYRAIKGLAELSKSRVSLAAVDAQEPGQADTLFRKLSGVCGQFLSCAVEPEPAVAEARHVAEVPLMICRASHDKAQLATANHWQVLAELVAQSKQHSSVDAPSDEAVAAATAPVPSPAREAHVAPAADIRTVQHPVSEPIQMHQPQEAHVQQQQQQQKQQQQSEPTNPALRGHAGPAMRLADMAEVIELSDAGGSDASILSAVMKHVMNEVVECPLRPPMCPDARLAVSRDRRIILIAVARHGLGDLRSIGLAYRWVVENRSLLAMALPQFALDAHQLPHLRLLVDQADSDADVLQPIFQADNVSIHTYRQVRWGERAGLLLDAA
jgi:hypothetical protein